METFNVFLFGVLIVVIVLLRLLAGSFDRQRIAEDVARRGGRVESIEWAPFGKGWFGERGDRIYRVRYVDARGRTRDAQCKTRRFSGVYWADDGMDGADDDLALRAENERLRQEVERLKRGGS